MSYAQASTAFPLAIRRRATPGIASFIQDPLPSETPARPVMNPIRVTLGGMGSDFIAQAPSWQNIVHGKIVQPGISDTSPEMLIISPPLAYPMRQTMGAVFESDGSVGDTGKGVPFDPAEIGRSNPVIITQPGQAAPQLPSPDMPPTPTSGGTIIEMPNPHGICPAWGCNGPSISAPVSSGGTIVGTPTPSPVTPVTPVTPIISNPAATAPPTTTTLVTGGTTNSSAAANSVTAAGTGTLTPLQQASGAVAINTAGQAVDANGNVIDTFDEVSTWLQESSLISSVPNWVLALAASAGLLLLYRGGKK